MKYYKIISILAGVVVIIALTVGITLGIQKAIHRKGLGKRMPHLAGVLGKDKPKDLLDTIKVVRAIDELGLSDEQIGKFISLSRRLSELRKIHHKERKEKIEGLEKLLKEKASAGDLEKIIAELKQVEDKFRSEENSVEAELDNLLTIEQQAKYIIFEQEFQHEMRRFVGGKPMGKRGPKHFKKGRAEGSSGGHPPRGPKRGAEEFEGPPGEPEGQIEGEVEI